METIILGGGCFWCLEAVYQLVAGVEGVISGYAGGDEIDPSYYDVAYGRTGHAEVVKISFQPKVISLKDILEIFFTIHDPTTLNQQGNDKGRQYRSIILYQHDSQKKIIEDAVASAGQLWDDPIVTEVSPLTVFYEAEPEHQNFFKDHPEQAYCQIIINPKLRKLQEKFASRLKASD